MGRVVKGAVLAKQSYQMKSRSAPRVARPIVPEFDQEVPDAQPHDVPVDFDAARAEAAKILDDAAGDARRLIEDARERSLQIVDDALERVEHIEGEARQKGFEIGVSDGRAAVQAEMDEMLETMRGLVEMARVERQKIVQAAEPEIVKLSVALAERILNAHVDVQPAAVLEMARAAITRLVGRETVTVRVNPADIEVMRDHRERLMAVNDIDNMRLVEDQRVDRGGVVIDTDAGTIDAKISTQLREVRRLLSVEEPMTVSPSGEPPIINAAAQAS